MFPPHTMFPPIHMSMNNTLGAILIGNIVGAILFGVTTLQTFIYFRGNHQDCRSFRLLIGFLWILDAIQIAFMTQAVYSYLVINFLNIDAIEDLPWTILGQVVVTCLAELIVRCIFARRIWLLSGHNNPLLFSIVLTSVLVFGVGLAFTIRGIIGVSFENLHLESWLLYTGLGSAVFVDALIAISSCVLLNHSRSGFKSSDSLVNTLMLYSINTGTVTSLGALACLVSYALWPHKFIFIGIFFIIGKVQINTVLTVLNTRSFLRARKIGVTTIPKSPSAVEPLSFIPTSSNSHVIIERPRPLALQYKYIRPQNGSWLSV